MLVVRWSPHFHLITKICTLLPSFGKSVILAVKHSKICQVKLQINGMYCGNNVTQIIMVSLPKKGNRLDYLLTRNQEGKIIPWQRFSDYPTSQPTGLLRHLEGQSLRVTKAVGTSRPRQLGYRRSGQTT